MGHACQGSNRTSNMEIGIQFPDCPTILQLVESIGSRHNDLSVRDRFGLGWVFPAPDVARRDRHCPAKNCTSFGEMWAVRRGAVVAFTCSEGGGGFR